jgi:hypothetical protein
MGCVRYAHDNFAKLAFDEPQGIGTGGDLIRKDTTSGKGCGAGEELRAIGL